MCVGEEVPSSGGCEALKGCNGNGTCRLGVCECYAGYGGPDCKVIEREGDEGRGRGRPYSQDLLPEVRRSCAPFPSPCCLLTSVALCLAHRELSHSSSSPQRLRTTGFSPSLPHHCAFPPPSLPHRCAFPPPSLPHFLSILRRLQYALRDGTGGFWSLPAWVLLGIFLGGFSALSFIVAIVARIFVDSDGFRRMPWNDTASDEGERGGGVGVRRCGLGRGDSEPKEGRGSATTPPFAICDSLHNTSSSRRASRGRLCSHVPTEDRQSSHVSRVMHAARLARRRHGEAAAAVRGRRHGVGGVGGHVRGGGRAGLGDVRVGRERAQARGGR